MEWVALGYEGYAWSSTGNNFGKEALLNYEDDGGSDVKVRIESKDIEDKVNDADEALKAVHRRASVRYENDCIETNNYLLLLFVYLTALEI